MQFVVTVTTGVEVGLPARKVSIALYESGSTQKVSWGAVSRNRADLIATAILGRGCLVRENGLDREYQHPEYSEWSLVSVPSDYRE